MSGLFLDGQTIALRVEFGHAVSFRILHAVAEHGCLAVGLQFVHGLFQNLSESGAVEYVVAQHQAYGIITYELASYDESLRQSVGAGLFGIFEADAIVRAVAEQTAETGQVVGSGYYQYLADAGQHQRRNGVVDHRLVVDRQHLFAHALGDGIQSRAGAAGQYNAFHIR